jgi:prepilin-type N-terminal cleavage/methylation domain-containing protein
LVGRATARIVIGMSHPRSSFSSCKRTSGYSGHVSQRSASARRAGYTLVELMIVVAITGVLAAIAIPAFSGWLNRSRSSEAAAFLGVIKLRQAAYRGEFGQYAGFGNTVANIAFVPGNATMMNGGQEFPFPIAGPPGPPSPPAPFWAIGATPDAQVRFGYGIVSGSPLQASGNAGGENLTNAPYNLPPAELDFYFIAHATTDLDEDGVPMVVECTSFSRDLWSSAFAKGWD